MTQTIVGVFDSPSQAAVAAESLVQAGISREGIDSHATDADVDPVPGNLAVGTEVASQNEMTSEGPMGHVQSFFAKLFGVGHDATQVRHFQEAARRGSTVLSVQVRDAAQAEAAQTLLQRNGAIDISQRLPEWRNTGYQG
ncbi:MAG: hypothetical protein ACRYG5_07510 [Janthinobacterium lividum]